MPPYTLKLLFVACFIAGCVLRAIYTGPWSRRGSGESATTVGRRRAGLEALLLLLVSAGMFVAPAVYLTTPWLAFADYAVPDWASTVGVAVFLVALWLLWRSHAELGRHWSARLEIRKEHWLVTEGVYRHVRHPMYTAHILWAVAQALLLHNGVAGPAFLVTLVPFCLQRIPQEERMLLDHFGEEYAAYVRRTGCLMPRMGRS